ncbi:MAG: hypothetical protein Q8N03_03830 [Ignavibacteria bacterium]|nr:hypothetical protein [Ignavibacteria bacterium]
MKTFILNTVFYLFIFQFSQISFAQSSTSTTITYEIPHWNTAGSFNINANQQRNEIGENFWVITFTSGDGNILAELSPSKIDEIIAQVNKIKSEFNGDLAGRKAYPQKPQNNLITNLEELKIFLKDDKKVLAFLDKIKNYKNNREVTPWEHTMSTIRNMSLELSGTIE